MYSTGIFLFFFNKMSYWIILNFITKGSFHTVVSYIFLVINRPLYGISLACFVIPMVLNKANVLRRVLSADIFICLSRLTYSAYLVHGLMIMWFLFSRPQIMFLSNQIYANLFISTAIVCFLVAVPFSILFEQPFIILERLISFQRSRYEEPS